MRGLKQLASTRVISPGHAFVQSLRRGHYELGWESTNGIGSQRSSLNSPAPPDRRQHIGNLVCLSPRQQTPVILSTPRSDAIESSAD
jgi:hypothetical protein